MNNLHVVGQRLNNQRLLGKPLEKPEDVVRWLGAVQAQEFNDAKWALGLRAMGMTDAGVEQAFTEGRILRTHVMRPTWHFVAPQDIRWLLKLTAPRVNASVGSYYRNLGLDERVFARSNDVIARALQGGKQLTRSELAEALNRAGIFGQDHDRLRLTFLVMRAELDGVICSGARRGKQVTYALLEERAPQAKQLDGDEALAELTHRYFSSHGPATAHDFSWWSGLTMAQVRKGLELVQNRLASDVIGDKMVWFSENGSQPMPGGLAWLLPAFDEYLIAYKDRSAALDPDDGFKMDREFRRPLVYNGQVIGTWTRSANSSAASVSLQAFAAFNKPQIEAIGEAIEQYSAFLGMSVELSQSA